MSKGKLIFNKIISNETRGQRTYVIRAWDSNHVEIKRTGFGSSFPGWTINGTLRFEPFPHIEWVASKSLLDLKDRQIVVGLEEALKKWFDDYANTLKEEAAEANAEWALL